MTPYTRRGTPGGPTPPGRHPRPGTPRPGTPRPETPHGPAEQTPQTPAARRYRRTASGANTAMITIDQTTEPQT